MNVQFFWSNSACFASGRLLGLLVDRGGPLEVDEDVLDALGARVDDQPLVHDRLGLGADLGVLLGLADGREDRQLRRSAAEDDLALEGSPALGLDGRGVPVEAAGAAVPPPVGAAVAGRGCRGGSSRPVLASGEETRTASSLSAVWPPQPDRAAASVADRPRPSDRRLTNPSIGHRLSLLVVECDKTARIRRVTGVALDVLTAGRGRGRPWRWSSDRPRRRAGARRHPRS